MKALLALSMIMLPLSAWAQDHRPAFEYLALKPASGQHLVYLRVINNLSFYTEKGDHSWGSRAEIYQLPLANQPAACKQSPAKSVLLAEKPACAPNKLPQAKLSYASHNRAFTVKDFNSAGFHASAVLNQQGDWLSVAYQEATYATSFLSELLMIHHLPSKKVWLVNPSTQSVIQTQLRKKFPAYFRDADTAALSPTPIGFSQGQLIFSMTLAANCMDSSLDDCMETLAPAGEKFAGYWRYNPNQQQLSFISWEKSAKPRTEPPGSFVRF